MKTSFKQISVVVGTFSVAAFVCTWAIAAGNGNQSERDHFFGAPGRLRNDSILVNGAQMIARGQEIFRSNTFGDEVFWSDMLQLNQAIAGAANGGIGAGLAPTQALALGLKIDASALPQRLLQRLKRGQVDLGDPATTLALLKADAVIGVRAVSTSNGIPRIGITCALCHSTVDDSITAGVGRRL